MKGTGKVILFSWIAVSFCVLYVGLKTSLFSVSYAIDHKSKILAKEQESYRHLKFEVDEMKAPHHLAERIQELKLDLDIPKEVHVMKIVPTPVVEPFRHQETRKQPIADNLISFMGRWVKVAQAKTES